MFIVCSLMPLVFENIPQLALQVVFAFDAAEMELYQDVSMVTTAMSVILIMFTKTTLAFLATDATITPIEMSSTRRDYRGTAEILQIDRDELVDVVKKQKVKLKETREQLAEYKEGAEINRTEASGTGSLRMGKKLKGALYRIAGGGGGGEGGGGGGKSETEERIAALEQELKETIAEREQVKGAARRMSARKNEEKAIEIAEILARQKTGGLNMIVENDWERLLGGKTSFLLFLFSKTLPPRSPPSTPRCSILLRLHHR